MLIAPMGIGDSALKRLDSIDVTTVKTLFCITSSVPFYPTLPYIVVYFIHNKSPKRLLH